MTAADGEIPGDAIKVVLADDEAAYGRVMARELGESDFDVTVVDDGRQLLSVLERQAPHVLLLDIRMPHVDGIDLLKEIKAREFAVQVIMVTGHATIDLAIEALKAGAYDFLTKPVNVEALSMACQRAHAHEMLRRDNRDLRDAIALERGSRQLLGTSQVMRDLHNEIRQVAPSHAHVLIEGESGVGKELVAHAIHRRSPRANRPYVTLNCAVLRGDLAMSSLFGHEKGAFTGAMERKRGLFEVANRGTLFLDEVGDLDPELQALLLRAVQFGEVQRVGSSTPFKVDVRVITATNSNLMLQCEENRFRRDLYYRLAGVQITVPPLRVRSDDIPELVLHFLSGRQVEVEAEAMRLLVKYHWPGNVRELENAIERLIIYSEGSITAEAVENHVLRPHRSQVDQDRLVVGESQVTVEDLERRHILGILEQFGGDKKQAADCLGISLKTIYNKLERYRS